MGIFSNDNNEEEKKKSVSAMPFKRPSPDEPYELSYIKRPKLPPTVQYNSRRKKPMVKKQQQQFNTPQRKNNEHNKKPRNFAKTLAGITIIILIIWIVAHIVNAIMNYQDMQYFKEHDNELSKETKDLINQGMKNANPGPFSHSNPYGNLK